jgi:outer membrane receptor protein involved in Fe transport
MFQRTKICSDPMKFKRTPLCTATTLALTGAMGLSALPAFGQTAAAPASGASAPAVEQVIVTGSRIRRIDAEGAAPVQTVTRDQITNSGVAAVGDLLQQLPSIAGAATNPQVNNGGGDGASTISLRGLGAERTLVLLDGRRLGPSFDVNSIPLNLIDRVDILKQGAGATYGSDAVGGVVNIITRKDITGFDASYQFGQSSRKDARTKDVELTFGTATDKSHVVIGLDYNKAGAVSAGNRNFSKHALYWYTYNHATQIVKLGSSSVPQGRITLPGSTVLPNGQTADVYYGTTKPSVVLTRKTGAPGTSLSDFRLYNSATDAYDYQPENLALTPQERSSIFLNGGYTVSDALELYTSALHNETTSGFQIATLPMVANNDGFATSADNPFGISFGATKAGGADGTNFQTRPVDLGTRHSKSDTTLNQLTVGGRGAIPNSTWDWDLAYTFQGSKESVSVDGYIQTGLLNNALKSNAFNIFNVTSDTPTGQASLASLKQYTAGYTDFYETNERTVDLSFSGDVIDWKPGTIKAAVGASYHKDTLNDVVDQITNYTASSDFSACGLAAETCSGNTAGDETVKEVYGELFVPLLSKMPFVQSLNLTLGSRYSHYASFGGTTNSSVKLEFRPVTDLMLRGTWSQVFRAPTIGNRFGAQQGTFPSFTDPCQNATGQEPGYAQACQYITPGSGYKQDNSQILAYLGGNQDLKPEKGKVFTLGGVYDSSLIKGLSLSLDYWHYRLNGAISAANPLAVVNNCLNSPSAAYCGRIHRDTTGQISYVDASEINAGFIQTNGIDLSAKYILPATSFGRFQIAVDATRTGSFKYDLGDGVVTQAAGTLDNTYGNFSKWRTSAQLNWKYQDVGVQWSTRYISAATVTASAGPAKDLPLLKEAAVIYHDVAASYDLKRTGTKFMIGARNLFDKQPPLAYQFVLNGNVDVNTYDTVGRQWYVRLEQSF